MEEIQSGNKNNSLKGLSSGKYGKLNPKQNEVNPREMCVYKILFTCSVATGAN